MSRATTELRHLRSLERLLRRWYKMSDGTGSRGEAECVDSMFKKLELLEKLRKESKPKKVKRVGGFYIKLDGQSMDTCLWWHQRDGFSTVKRALDYWNELACSYSERAKGATIVDKTGKVYKRLKQKKS